MTETRHSCEKTSVKTIQLLDPMILFPESRKVLNNPNYKNSKKSLFSNELSSTKQITIILADDDTLNRKSSLRILQTIFNKFRLEYKIIEADDGLDCISKINECFKKDLFINMIICDESMTYFNGTDVAATLLKIKNKNIDSIPFYLLTSYVDFESEYIKRDKIITKPLTELSCKKMIENFINI